MALSEDSLVGAIQTFVRGAQCFDEKQLMSAVQKIDELVEGLEPQSLDEERARDLYRTSARYLITVLRERAVLCESLWHHQQCEQLEGHTGPHKARGDQYYLNFKWPNKQPEGVEGSHE